MTSINPSNKTPFTGYPGIPTTQPFKTSGESEDDEIRQQVVREIDKVGLYQLMIFLIVSLPLMLSPIHGLGYVFTAGEVDYRCLVPECENLTSAQWMPPWIHNAAPSKSDEIKHCTRYVVRENISDSETCTAAFFTKTEQSCNVWVYDPNEKTILNEWDITCDENRWKLALVGTMNNIGQFVGLIFAGYLSDRFGRTTMLSIQTFVTGIIGIIQSFSVNYLMFVCFEFLQAVASIGIFSTGFILAMEMVAENRRVLGGSVVFTWYAVGEILLGLVAMLLPSWRTLLRVFFIPALLGIFLPAFLPESIRWLIVNEKTSKVDKIYKKMAKINGFEMNDAKVIIFRELNSGNFLKEEKKEEPENRVLIRQALSSTTLVIRLIACSICWLTNTFVFYGLSLNAVAIAGDKYTNFMLVALVEIPGAILSYFLIKYAGRKITLSSSYLISGIFCLAIEFIPADSASYLPLILFLGGKGFITIAFNTTYVYTAEMFPTMARHSLVAICSMIGRIGSILAPQTILLVTIMESLPLILFGCMGIIAGFVSLVFPETRGSRLPDTVAEAENIGKATKDTTKVLGSQMS